MLNIADLSFHDSTVMSFVSDGTALRMEIEDVTTRSEDQCNLALTFKDVVSIKIDGAPVNRIESRTLEGTLLSFESANNHANFFIEWYDYTSKTRDYANYEFTFSALEVEQLSRTD